MNSQSNLEGENPKQETRSSSETNVNKINQDSNSQNIDDSNNLQQETCEQNEDSESENSKNNQEILANLYGLIDELDIVEMNQQKAFESSPAIPTSTKQLNSTQSAADQNFSSTDLEPQSPLLKKLELKKIKLSSPDSNSSSLVNLTIDNHGITQSSSTDSDEDRILANKQSTSPITLKSEKTNSETLKSKNSTPKSLEYSDDLYNHNYIDSIIKQDVNPQLDDSISLLNIEQPNQALESIHQVSPHWLVQKERQINDLANSINTLLPLVVELSQTQTNGSHEHILKNLVPIIDQVIQQRSIEDQQKMAEAIASLLPKAIQKEIQQEPKSIGQAIAPELALSITEQIRLDEDAIPEALGSEMGKAIKNQIEKEPEAMVDALYPVIGSTIAKYMAEVVESINERVDNALSPKGIQRKIQAKIQGVSEAELILQESLAYRVQAVFLIQNKSGLVIAELQPQQESRLESDLLAGMLTAIRSFANDCIVSNSELDEIDYGNFQIMFETSGYCYLAVVVNGESDRRFRDRIRKVLTNINHKYGNEIKQYQGEQETNLNVSLKKILEELQTDNSQAKSSKSPKTLYWLIGILLLTILVPWGILSYQHSVRTNIENNVAIQLDANPELSVYRLTPKIKKKQLLLQGRVPTKYLANLATQVTTPIAQEAQLELDNQIVTVNIPHDPNLTEQEIKRTVEILNQHSLNQNFESILDASYTDQTVTIKGLFIDTTRQKKLIKTFRAIPGVENVIFVINNQLPKIDTRIYFPAGANDVSSPQELAKLDDVLIVLNKYPWLKLKIISHSDNVGSKNANLKLGKNRADNIYQNLINRGIKPDRLKVIATIQPPPDIIESQSATLKRCIRFELFGINSN